MLFLRMLMFCVGAFGATFAPAQGFPQKPVRIIVPFAAGSATDSVARVLSQYLGERTKATFIVEDRPGANGAIAAEYVAKSRPDGYSVLLATVSTHSQMPWLMKKLPYDPIKDFTPIAGLGGFSFVIVVHPSLPVKTMTDFTAFAKARPNQIAYGAPGGTAQICAETVARRAGIKLVPVTYKSSPQSLTELIAGQIGVICSDFATAVPFIKSARVRALAITTYERSSELPNVPALRDTFPDIVEIRSWIGALAPAGSPNDVAQWLEREILAATSEPGFASRLAPLGFGLMRLDSAQLAEFMQTELEKWQALIKDAGIEAQ